ncbi:aldehyde dehydrogenase family protein [Spirochaeta thermophila]|uniref:Aldehyde dehydrogenase 22A1 n=1 Tax=Winmispira thermophila (strain ATCC 49972 / DSM 6192 / RI 19.B1) TaxID=665571 RepID=E0RT52_WINT6|nr:aldehyde dehydrogenase family protein [Spirochaeta thermophila]ADN02348.1 aldehyde dehydrogenase 22A1 precursor [Spirochaeta thermophila DSM 6192]
MNRTYTVSRDPYTGEELGRFPVHTSEEVREAIARAREASRVWRSVPPRERARRLLRVREVLVEEGEAIALAISRENGKVPTDAMATEVFPAAVALTYYCRMAPRWLKDERPGGASVILAHKRVRITREPWGVVGVISPWNYPFAIPFSEVVCALLAGNGVVLKTASISQLVAHRLAGCFERADLPEGLFSLVNVPGRVAEECFLGQGGVDKLCFTGSVAVGRRLAERAGARLVPVVLELGGNDPALVLEDADLDRAAWGIAWAGFQNAGQSCGGVERVYVQEGVYEAFLERLAGVLEGLRYGLDGRVENDLAGLSTEEQARVVREHVEDALARGARVYYRKGIPEPWAGHPLSVPPTVLVEVDHSMRVMREETFGPVVGVMRVGSVEEGVRLANEGGMGLTASVWSRDRRKALRIARMLEAGVVTVNDHLMSHGLPQAPWGGWKDSGLGWTHGRRGFEEMVRLKVLVDDVLSRLPKQVWWHPYGEGSFGTLGAGLRALYGRGVWERVKGWVRLVRGVVGKVREGRGGRGEG